MKGILFLFFALVSSGLTGKKAAAQNVGIGTIAPTALLEVAGADAKINGLTIGKGQGNIFANVVLGDSALQVNISGHNNTAIGSKTLFKNTEGYINVAIGRLALQNNTKGNDNVAIGGQALFLNDTGSVNTAVGDLCLLNNINGYYNTGIGGRALMNNISGTGNTATGLSALRFSLAGNYNSAVGYAAGVNVLSGSGNTLIGAFSDVTAPELSKSTAIGYNAKVGASNSIILGGTGSDAVNVGINLIVPKEKLHINGAITISNGGYSGITDNATVPVPSGGAGTLVFFDNHFFGWNGTLWKQLDN